MLQLQEFKKTVNETVLDTLMRSGRLPAAFFALTAEGSDEPFVYQSPLNPDAFIITGTQQKISDGVKLCHELMRQPGRLMSCLALPQYVVRFRLKGELQERFLSFIYNRAGELLPTIYQWQQAADEHHVTLTAILSLTFEYPVGQLRKQPVFNLPNAKLGMVFSSEPPQFEDVLGVTHQVISTRPHDIMGLQYCRSDERGTEYGDVMPPLVGRALRPGVLIEQSQYSGSSPWTLTWADALPTLEGRSSSQFLSGLDGFL